MPPFGELQYLPDAQDALTTERRRLASESAAFRTFAERLASLDPATSEAVTGTPTAQTETLVLSSRQTAGIGRVREAYRETVMGVPHFEDDYGEPLEANMAAELGDEIAQAIASRQTLTPMLKQSLVHASRVARTSRNDLLDALDREAEALTSADAELDRLAEAVPPVPISRSQCSYEALVAAWRDLRNLECEYDRLCRDRQAQLEAHRRLPRVDGTVLFRYLYEDLEVTYPVLADAVDQCRLVRERRGRILSLLSWTE